MNSHFETFCNICNIRDPFNNGSYPEVKLQLQINMSLYVKSRRNNGYHTSLIIVD